MAKKVRDAELLETLGDFTSKENWDKFFTLRGSEDPFEWYIEWPILQKPLFAELPKDGSPQILVPGCGNSRISEYLYDNGFKNITNIDFSKVVVSDMLRMHIRSRPEMKWRVMDMTSMQFTDGFFDVVLDKGGLDALMEPEHGSLLGSQYLLEVKRVMKLGGKYVCLTLAESHVLGLLFSTFRFGWKTTIHVIPNKSSHKHSFQTFMFVSKKENSSMPTTIGTSFDLSNIDCNGHQGRGLLQALESENKIRNNYSSGADIMYSFNDLQLGAKGDLKELVPGRRAQLILGSQDDSRFSYEAILLDSQQQSEPFVYHFGVFLVPATRAHEWLFSSEEGQWLIVQSSRAARLIMVILDAGHIQTSIDDIQKDLSPLVKKLAPENLDNGAQIPFLMANDGVQHRNIIQQVTSSTTGQITVEDVIYANSDSNGSETLPPQGSIFRRLTFERSLGLIQSEALVISKESPTHKHNFSETVKKTVSSKSRKKGNQKRNDSSKSLCDVPRDNMKVDHSYLASSYHSGIISGLVLIASNLENAAASTKTVRTVIVGLGAGLLPMFLHENMPVLDIEVVELDPVISDISKDYFGFKEDKHLKVHITDGIQFIKEVENALRCSKTIFNYENGADFSKEGLALPTGCGMHSTSEAKKPTGIDILIIDADSADLSFGLTCPPAAFTEESFLLSVKESLSEGGLFVTNLVSRSQAVRETVVSRMKAVFSNLFCLKLEEELNMVLFALPTHICENDFTKATIQLQKLMKMSGQEKGPSNNIMETTKKIKCLK